MASGAGAWKVPKEYWIGMVLPEDKFQRQRVSWAVTAIQNELARRGLLDVPGRGTFGPQTEAAVRKFQALEGLNVNGRIDPSSARKLWKPFFDWHQARLNIPNNLLYGQARLESAMDPGAEGTFDANDRGLFQYNRIFFPQISDETAYSDIPFLVEYSADRLRAAYDGMLEIVNENHPNKTQADKERLAWLCAIAHHNNPSKARMWAKQDSPPDQQIAEYVWYVYLVAGQPI